MLSTNATILLFVLDFHEWLLSEEVDLLTFLLLPLAGPEELKDCENEELPLDLQYLPADKKREPDAAIQILLMESIFQVSLLLGVKLVRMYCSFFRLCVVVNIGINRLFSTFAVQTFECKITELFFSSAPPSLVV